MTDELKPLLENELLTDDAKTQLKEAWEKKLEEAREEIEVKLREEFASRYDHDKGCLLEAVERMVEDGLKAEIAEFVQDRNSLTEQRVKLANELREARIENKTKLSEQMELLEKFVLAHLGTELKEFQADRTEVREAKKDLAKQLRESRVVSKKQLAGKIQVIEKFILAQLKSELKEFQDDKQALVNQRVKMIEEGKAKINETRKEFIRRSAKLVEEKLDGILVTEMTQFKGDIEASRRKHFGMQLFEAFAAEYQASFFNENNEVRKLKKKVVENERKLGQAANLFEKAQELAKGAQKRQLLAESQAERVGVMNDLLSKLSGKQKDIMAELLESVKTEKLRSAFRKYIPAVTSGSGNTALSRVSGKSTLRENKKVLTGNKENKLLENAKAEVEAEGDDTAAEIIELKRLAGV